jgi:hypothetical protein
MKAEKIDLKNGYIKICEYEPNDKLNIRVRSVIGDIYNVSNFDKNIIYILKVGCSGGFTISDVITEYIDKEWKKNSLIITQAGTLAPIPEAGSIIDGLEVIRLERELLHKASFYNIIFNRVAVNSYGNSDLFIYYNNKISDSFIKNNIGENEDGKLINRLK